MTIWLCSECSTKNRGTGRFCEQCGSARNPALSSSVEGSTTFLPPWKRPGFRPSTPSDRCTEPGCTKLVADHIAEIRAIVSRPGTVFTRLPAVVVNEHEGEVRRQAALLRLGAEARP